jgi:hypothetical protein
MRGKGTRPRRARGPLPMLAPSLPGLSTLGLPVPAHAAGDDLLRAVIAGAHRSEVNANPKDNKDHPNGVWSRPPTLRGGDVDRARFLAIGESDRFTHRYVKVG